MTRPVNVVNPLPGLLAEVLGDVLGVEQVPADSHFFDDLGADSMVMARFCARVRKRADLPSVSIKDVYQHPTITSLAAASTPHDAPVETAFAALLADVVGVGVGPEENFFDDLGADSMVMARFCARVRKRADLPSVSIKDVYAHPTVRSLAAARADATPVSGRPSAPPPMRSSPPPPRASTGEFVLCGTLQVLFFLGYVYLGALIFDRSFQWISAGASLADDYLRSVEVGCTVFLSMSLLPIIAKWVLVGRWRPRQIRVWSLDYVRFWLVKTLVATNPLVLFAGSPIYPLYLRALGAKVGRGVVIFSRHVPVCADLLVIGDGAVVEKDAFLNCYRAVGQVIQIGPVVVGRDVFVGEKAVLDIGASLGDGAQLGHASSLQTGQVVPAGEHWHGSPGQPTDADYQGIAPADCGRWRGARYALLQLGILLGLTLPVAFGALAMLFNEVPWLAALLDVGPAALTSPSFYGIVLISSVALFAGGMLFSVLAVMTVPRLLNLALRPDEVYPLYGVQYAFHRLITRMTNRKFFHELFGDSSYIVHYLQRLGYKLAPVVQTGSNFGTEVKHDNPYLSAIGSGTVVASGISIVNANYSSTSFRVSRTSIGARNFLGNDIVYPPQGRTGDNCLLATKVLVPITGEVREGVGLLGSPSFEIPRTVRRDTRFHHLAHGADFPRRLAAKNRHNLVSIGFFLLSRWFFVFALLLIGLSTADLYDVGGAAVIAVANATVLLFTIIYFATVERASTGFRGVRPKHCSIYEIDFWRTERFFKLCARANVHRLLNGTPFKALVWRLLGVRVGRRLFDDGAGMSEKNIVTIGDDVTLNAGAYIQCHSQEDYAFKSDATVIGSRCTVGVAAMVHYGVTMGDDAVLAPDSFLMKGEEVPPHQWWGGNPAREMPAADPFAPARHTRVADPPASPAREPCTAIPPRAPSIPSVPPVRRSGVHDHCPRRHPVTTPAEDPTDSMTEPGRAFWIQILAAGGSTTVPRWTLDPVPGVAEHETPIPRETVVAARRLAYELAVPLRTVLLAAHARVLAALSGERDVVTGYVADHVVRPLPCRLSTEPASWRAVVQHTRRVESGVRAYAGFPVDDLRRELDLPSLAFESVFDATAVADVGAGVTMHVGFPERDGRRVLRVRYRTDVLDADCAARIAGYHLTALEQIIANPDAEHRGQCLLSPDELRFQLDGLAGPVRELPDHRVHELFEERVTRHPDAIAAVHRDRSWTYGELNARANRLGRALLARGLPREAVVAVVTERNLDWMAAVLAIWKAGHAYLPLEPHFPAARMATALSRAGCRLVLTERASASTLDQALDTLPGVERLMVDTAYDEGCRRGNVSEDENLGVAVAPDQLAYVLFTSGSTGEPKGVMCEHAGMLNHVVAKLEDLKVAEGEVIPQTGPQCFDISVWQLVGALLVGGRTLLVEQEAILDVDRFLDTIVTGRAAVLQVVPSYLDVILTCLEQRPRALPDLHTVCPTGDLLKKELVQRWFAAQPAIPMVNTYGLTETSDDAVHALMDRVPDQERIPLGRPIINTRVDVVDEHGRPVPLGAPGLIVFSGVCAGRGYINDPERTSRVFGPDPLRPRQRICRTGDHGRWQPDGTLDFLGRRDNQVKIRGFRIEIGEVENALLRVSGVRDGAAVVADGSGRTAQLVGFYSAPQPLGDGLLRDRLAQTLPEYMVPARCTGRRPSR